jgi:cyclase
MESNLAGPWRAAEIDAAIAERGRSEPEWERAAREKWADLQITLPTEVFEKRRDLTIGRVRLEVIHVDAHSPDSAIVWLPEEGALFAGDLIFQGCYPYLGDADVRAWIEVLERFQEMDAAVIIPGHGRLCGEPEVQLLIDYLAATWERTAEHLAQGRSADEAAADGGYPRYAEEGAERFHEANIRLMFAQLAHGDE